jgi:hypothetical protein
MTPDDWAVLADRLQIEDHPRADALMLGLDRGPTQLGGLTPAADMAPLLDDWRWVLLLGPLTEPQTRWLYGQLRPRLEHETRQTLPVGGSLTQLARQLRQRARARRGRRRAMRSDRQERLVTLSRLLDPMLPDRWRWQALALLLRGDARLIEIVGEKLPGWCEYPGAE